MGRVVIRSALVNVPCFGIEASKLGALACRRCRAPLDLHQPNPNQPDQFLGTCTECGQWYRVEAKADEPKALVVQLPEVEEVRAAKTDPGYPGRTD